MADERYIDERFRDLQRENQVSEFVRFKVLHREPKRPRHGDVVMADGTDWDPGSGEGLYVRKTAGWSFLG